MPTCHLPKGIALFYVGFYIRFDLPITGEPVHGPGYIALLAIYIFATTHHMFVTLGKSVFGAYFGYGSFCFVMVVIACFFVPETAGRA
ncbi:hypothetical protein CORC01_00646 [Colletotrichum orchidophilum]|uniref:Uncharacterized protein n=1 Tax=Colletotrichum orchidophilum TaxID=1209926 RepID=A0A1G4BSS1_9PEZI|nr:uncharacterized protein CORC01_00646 [Colletotrichum orchidophilum]OHF04307.1 hypothetical protein CORC01_00646 [Colletotrichum orchidophilum]